MVSIRADRREIRAEPDPEGEAVACATAKEYVAIRLRMARALLRLERSGTFHLSACSSIVQYAAKLGIGAADARALVDLARTLDAPVEELRPPAPAADGAPSAAPAPAAGPSIEDRVRGGRISTENAAALGRLLRQPGLVRPGEDWLHQAETLPAHALRRRVNERLEQAAQGTPELVALSLHVTALAREAFHRARSLASREAGLALTEGQAFTLLVRSYLETHDELRKGAGARRVGPTSERPGERYIPAAAKREVLERSGDRCEVPGCPHTVFLEFAHAWSHADGGDREAPNLLRLCHAHHVQFDAGVLVLAGRRDGRPVFRNARGEDVGVTALTLDACPLPGAAAMSAREFVEADAGGIAATDAVDHSETDDDHSREPMQVSERAPPRWAPAEAIGVP